MKKHLSVFGLFARSTVYKVLVIVLLMCVAEAGIFWRKLNNAVTEYYDALGVRTEYDDPARMLQLEEIFEKSGTGLFFGIAFVLITVLICCTGMNAQTQTGYTLKRLSISEKHVFLHQAAYNMIVYLFLWAVQMLMCFGLSYLYTVKAPTELMGNQTIFLAFYRNPLLHGILPLDDVIVWIKNVLLLLALGFSSAACPYDQRRTKKLGGLIIFFVPFTLLFFRQGFGESFNRTAIICASLLSFKKVHSIVFSKEAEDEA